MIRSRKKGIMANKSTKFMGPIKKANFRGAQVNRIWKGVKKFAIHFFSFQSISKLHKNHVCGNSFNRIKKASDGQTLMSQKWSFVHNELFFSLLRSKSEEFILLFDFEMLILDQLLGEIVEIYIEKFSMAIEHIDWKV